MRPFKQFPNSEKKKIRFVLTDIDDTLTNSGRLPSQVFIAMEQLRERQISVIPITGRPAGWCDHIARMWPIDGLVGENGAFYFKYDMDRKKMIRKHWKSAPEREEDRIKLKSLEKTILNQVPGCKVSADQQYREADLAIDFCEDVPPLGKTDIQRIVELFRQAGATAKVSSIHVNGWFGDYDKLAMTRLFFKEIYDITLEEIRDEVIFTGDSPNDSPMFGFFPNGVGVANVLEFEGQMENEPTWVTSKEGGFGFAEMVQILLS